MKYLVYIPARLIFCFILMINGGISFAQALPDLIPYVDNGKWGYADTNGKVRIKPQWDEAGFFQGNTAVVQLSRNNKRSIARIDKKGNYIVKPERNWTGTEFYNFGSQSMSFNAHTDSEKYGIVDQNNKVIIPLIYDRPETDSKSPEWERYTSWFRSDTLRRWYYAVVSKDGKFGLIDSNNKTLIPFEYDGFYRSYDAYNCPAKYLITVKDGKMMVIDTNNNVIIAAKYDHIMFDGSERGDIRLYDNDRTLIADSNGRIYLDIPGYNVMYGSYFETDSLIAATKIKTGRSGILNAKHEEVIPFEYYSTYISHDTITLMQDSLFIPEFKRYFFQRYLSSKTLQPISDWYTVDPRLLPPVKKAQENSNVEKEFQYDPYKIFLRGKDLVSLEKDGILWRSTSYLNIYSFYNCLSGYRLADSAFFTAVIDTNGSYIIGPLKSNGRIITGINSDDKLLIAHDTSGFTVTDYTMNAIFSFTKYEIQKAFIYDGHTYIIEHHNISIANGGNAGSYNYVDASTNKLIADDSSITEKFSKYSLLSICDQYGVSNIRGYADGRQDLDRPITGYFQAVPDGGFGMIHQYSSGKKAGIIDIKGNVIAPEVSFKYERFEPCGYGFFLVQDMVARYSGRGRGLFEKQETENVPSFYKGQPYMVDMNNKVLLDSLTIESAGPVVNYRKITERPPLLSILLKRPESNGISAAREKYNVFYMDRHGRIYHGELLSNKTK